MGAQGMQSLVMLGLMVLVFYFFMIRPQMKKQKELKNFRENLKAGDKVVTKSGLHGKLLSLNDDGTCVIETGAGKMKFEISSISMEISAKVNTTAAKK